MTKIEGKKQLKGSWLQGQPEARILFILTTLNPDFTEFMELSEIQNKIGRTFGEGKAIDVPKYANKLHKEGLVFKRGSQGKKVYYKPKTNKIAFHLIAENVLWFGLDYEFILSPYGKYCLLKHYKIKKQIEQYFWSPSAFAMLIYRGKPLPKKVLDACVIVDNYKYKEYIKRTRRNYIKSINTQTRTTLNDLKKIINEAQELF